MTALLDRAPTTPPTPTRRRPRWAIVAVVVVIIANGCLLGSQAVRLRAQVTRERRALTASQSVEAIARQTIAGLGATTATAIDNRAETIALDREQRNERATAYTSLVKLEQRIDSTNKTLTNTQTAQVQVAQYSAERDGCINGVQGATNALQHGDGSAAVAALNAAAAACSTALAAATGARFPYDFPDPSVLRVGSRYYAYSTNSGAGNIQVLTSTDLAHWSIVGDGLAGLPGWAVPGATWAPAVVAIGSTFVAYYTARDAVSGVQCVSVAVAASPTGPFVDSSPAPMVCQPSGSIDPSPYVDSTGAPWLLWKSEATGTAPTGIWSQPLSADGLTFEPASTPTALLTPGQRWEHGVVEGPSMMQIDGRLYLFYSGGFWTTAGYSEGVVSCDGPAGPCHRILSGPVLASSGRLAGPGGGAAFVTSGGTVWLAFHAYAQPDVGYPNSRTLHLATVRIVAGVPVVTPE